MIKVYIHIMCFNYYPQQATYNWLGCNMLPVPQETDLKPENNEAPVLHRVAGKARSIWGSLAVGNPADVPHSIPDNHNIWDYNDLTATSL